MNKKIIVINVVSLLVIAVIASYFLFFNEKRVSKEVRQDISIENICDSWQDKQSGEKRSAFEDPSSARAAVGEPAADKAGLEERPGDNSEKLTLMAEICADGEVTEEEKLQFEKF